MFLSQAPDLAARALQEQKAEQEKEIADLKKQLENECKVKLSLSTNTSTVFTHQLHLGPLRCLFSQSVRSFHVDRNPTPITS